MSGQLVTWYHSPIVQYIYLVLADTTLSHVIKYITTWHNVVPRDSRLRLTHLNYSLHTARCFHSVLSRAANCTSASWLTQFNKTSYRPISDENEVTWSATSQWEVEERVRRQKCSNEAEKTSWTRGDWLSAITWLECSSVIGCWRVCLLFNECRVGE